MPEYVIHEEFTHPLRLTFREVGVVVRLVLNTSGTIVRALSPFGHLPEAAVRLSFGTDSYGLLSEFNREVRCLQYQLVGALYQPRHACSVDIADLAAEIDRRLAERGCNWRSLPPARDMSETVIWLRQALGLTELPITSYVREQFYHNLRVLLFVEREEEQQVIDAVYYFRKYGGTTGRQLLLDHYFLLPESGQRGVIGDLSAYPTEGNRRFLLERLRNPGSENILRNVLQALAAHNHDDVRDDLLRLYASRELSASLRAALVVALESYPGEDTRSVSMEVANQMEQNSAYSNVRACLRLKVPEEDVMSMVLTHLRGTDPASTASALSALRLFQPDRLPTHEELWERIVYCLTELPHGGVEKNIPALLVRARFFNLDEKLVDGMGHEGSPVRNAMLHLIGVGLEHLKRKEKTYLTLTDGLVATLVDLTFGEHKPSAYRALNCLPSVPLSRLPKDINHRLAEQFTDTKTAELVRRKILAFWQEQFTTHPYDDTVTVALITSLTSRYDQSIVLALRLLQFSEAPEVTGRVAAFVNHPNAGIAAAARGEPEMVAGMTREEFRELKLNKKKWAGHLASIRLKHIAEQLPPPLRPG